METLVASVFLAVAIVLAISVPIKKAMAGWEPYAESIWVPVRALVSYWFCKKPLRIFLAPLLLSFLIFGTAGYLGTLDLVLVSLTLIYTFGVTLMAHINGHGFFIDSPNGSWFDLVTILWLWLPVEYATGKDLLDVYFGRFTHVIAFGTAFTLALFLFLVFRLMPDMKYNFPSEWKDAIWALAGLIIALPSLIFLGRRLSFIKPFHIKSGFTAFQFLGRLGGIFVGVALVEEVLFRSLIQNWFMQEFGSSFPSSLLALCLASLVFGLSHLNNSTELADGTKIGFPNWRYAALGTVAGVIYGKVFQESSSVIPSAGLHAIVNTTWFFFFK